MGVIGSEMYEALLLADVPKDKAGAAAAEVAKGRDLASKVGDHRRSAWSLAAAGVPGGMTVES